MTLKTMHDREMIVYAIGKKNIFPNSDEYFTEYCTAEGENKEVVVRQFNNMSCAMGQHFILIAGGETIAMVVEKKGDMDVMFLVDMEGERQSSSDQAFTFVDEALCLCLSIFAVIFHLIKWRISQLSCNFTT